MAKTRKYNKRTAREKARLIRQYERLKYGNHVQFLESNSITTSHLTAWRKQEAVQMILSARS